jgi:hypothetical protein
MGSEGRKRHGEGIVKRDCVSTFYISIPPFFPSLSIKEKLFK